MFIIVLNWHEMVSTSARNASQEERIIRRAIHWKISAKIQLSFSQKLKPEIRRDLRDIYRWNG
jgi:hypothetical protein